MTANDVGLEKLQALSDAAAVLIEARGALESAIEEEATARRTCCQARNRLAEAEKNFAAVVELINPGAEGVRR